MHSSSLSAGTMMLMRMVQAGMSFDLFCKHQARVAGAEDGFVVKYRSNKTRSPGVSTSKSGSISATESRLSRILFFTASQVSDVLQGRVEKSPGLILRTPRRQKPPSRAGPITASYD